MRFPNTDTFKIASNTVSQIAGRIVSSGATFAITLILASLYGSAGYGELTKVLTYTAFFYLFVDFGINAMYLSQSADEDQNHEPGRNWTILFSTRVLLSIIFIFLAAGILVFIPTGDTSGYTPYVKFAILAYLPSILFQALVTSTNAEFQKRMRYDLSLIAIACGSFTSLVLVFLSTKLFLPNIAIIASLLSFLIGICVQALTAVYFIRSFFPLSIRFDFRESLVLLSKSVPLGLTLMFNVVYFRADTIIIALTRPTTDVGIYGLAYKFFEFPLALPTFFMNAVYPILLVRLRSAQTTGNFREYSGLIKKTALLLLCTSIVISIAAWVLAPSLSYIRQDFHSSIFPFRILTAGLPLFFLSSLFMWIIIAWEKQIFLAFLYGIVMCMTITADMYFIPTYGYIAASVITGVSECVLAAVCGVYIIKLHKQFIGVQEGEV